MKVALINRDESYERLKGPFEIVEIVEPSQIESCWREFEGVRKKLLEEMSRFGRRGYRITDDFDVTEQQVFAVGSKLFRYLDLCIISRKFLKAPFLEPVYRLIRDAAPTYCISVHTDLRNTPRLWLFMRSALTEIYCEDKRLLESLIRQVQSLE